MAPQHSEDPGREGRQPPGPMRASVHGCHQPPPATTSHRGSGDKGRRAPGCEVKTLTSVCKIARIAISFLLPGPRCPNSQGAAPRASLSATASVPGHCPAAAACGRVARQSPQSAGVSAKVSAHGSARGKATAAATGLPVATSSHLVPTSPCRAAEAQHTVCSPGAHMAPRGNPAQLHDPRGPGSSLS